MDAYASMMKGFGPITLEWAGETFTVPADKVFPLVGMVEEIILGPHPEPRIPAVALLLAGSASQHRMASAFGAALRYAGSTVSDEEIYLSIQQQLAGGDIGSTMFLQAANIKLIELISPPFALDIAGDGEEEKNGSPTEPSAKSA